MNKKLLHLRIATGAGLGLVLGLCVGAWLDYKNWSLSGLRPTSFLSLAGLVAFGTMLSHYLTGFMFDVTKTKDRDLGAYHKITARLVLFCLVAHPVLVVANLRSLGFGLPPQSYSAYYGDKLTPFIMLGTISWLSFIAFEFKKWLSQKGFWRYVLYANDIAMVAIVVHGFKLGSTLKLEWFRYVWFIFALVLAICLIYKYFVKIRISRFNLILIFVCLN